MVQNTENNNKMCIERNEIIEILDERQKLNWAETKGEFALINNKLDNITKQTEKTNGRVNELEKKTQQKDITDASRLSTCPYRGDIESLKENNVTTRTLKRLVIQAVIFGGIFFTILFSIISIIVDSNKFTIFGG